MRIAIVNDIPLIAIGLQRIVRSNPRYSIAWVARDGAEAVAACQRDRPDIILMDIFMPVMNGIEATREIMRTCPCAILVVTADMKKNTAEVFETLAAGAMDVISTPVGAPEQGDPSIAVFLRKIRQLSQLIDNSQSAPPTPTTTVTTSIERAPLVAIGSSTGGPGILALLLASLPKNLPVPVVIVQHIDADFAPGLIAWLNDVSQMPVVAAQAHATLQPGTVYLAATNDHLVLTAGKRFRYEVEPVDYPYRPSVDVFFQSAAAHWPTRSIALLLTGMGRDGAQGLLALRQKGWHTIAQEQKSCAVYGMPKAAVDLNAAVSVLHPDQMVEQILKFIGYVHV